MRPLCGPVLLIFSLKFIRTPSIVGRLSSWVTWRIFCIFSSVLVEDRWIETSENRTEDWSVRGFSLNSCFHHGYLPKAFINNRSWFLWVKIKLPAKSAISLVYEDHSTHRAQTYLHVNCKNTRRFCATFATAICNEWNQRYLTTHSCVMSG